MKATISIIGFGRLGQLLQKTLQRAGYDQISVIRKDDDIVFLNDFVFICVPDDSIQRVVNDIQNSGLKIKGKTFVHSSGILGSDILSGLNQKKTNIGCLHPLMAITESSDSFEGITFDASGDKNFIYEIGHIVADLDANLIVVDEHEKAKLHVAAVITSNYLVTLMGLAEELFDGSDLSQEQVKQALLPLMNSALNNLDHSTPSEALTGPIARGDFETIQQHLELLESHEDQKSTYKRLGIETVRLLRDSISEDQRAKLVGLFDEA